VAVGFNAKAVKEHHVPTIQLYNNTNPLGTAESRVISKVARGPEKAFRILGALEMVYCGLLGAFIGYKEGRAKSYQEDPAMPHQ
jgi:hypothetical protein